MQNHFEKARNRARSIVKVILFGDNFYTKKTGKAEKLQKEMRDINEELFDSKSLISNMQLWNAHNKEAQVKRFKTSIKAKNKQISKKQKKVYRLRFFLRYAAVFTIIFGTCYFMYTSYNSNYSPTEQSANGYSENRANLILSSGERIMIKSDEIIDLSKSSRLIVETTIDSEKIKISAKGVETTVKYHTIETPKGGGYTLELTDGSVVKLNADSRLRFPSSFTEKQRKVYLDGEAYFEIAHNKKQPFIVMTKSMGVEVLGTKFNIKAHSNDEKTYATLASGSVKVFGAENGNLLLAPSEQAVFTKSGAFIQKRNVNLSSILGWIEGRFIFKDESLENILKQLSRWYNVEISYEKTSLKTLRFTGDINRFEDINSILNILNKTYTVQLLLKNNKVVVVENNNLNDK